MNSISRITREVESRDRGRQLVLKLQIRFFDKYTGETIPIYAKYPINSVIITVKSKAVDGPFEDEREEWFKKARENILIETCNNTVPKFWKGLKDSLGGDNVDFEVKIVDEDKKYSGIFVPLYIIEQLAILEDMPKKYMDKLQYTIKKLRLWYGLDILKNKIKNSTGYKYMTNEKIEEKKIEQITDDHITFKCNMCQKFFDLGREVVDIVGSTSEKKNYGIQKYFEGIQFHIDENEKCDDMDDGLHSLMTTEVSSRIIDGIISKVNKDGTEIAKTESEYKSILVKKSQQEKEFADLQLKVADLQLKMDERMSNIAKLDENSRKVQSEKSILVNDIENLRGKFKSFTGTRNIERWTEIKRK